jgi:hypothetical protein
MDFRIAWETRHGRREILEASAAGTASRVQQLQDRGAAWISVSRADTEISLEELPNLARSEAKDFRHCH